MPPTRTGIGLLDSAPGDSSPLIPRLADDDDDDDEDEALLPDVDAPDLSPLCPSDLADRPEPTLILEEDILTLTRTL